MNHRVQRRLLGAWLVLSGITLSYLAIDRSGIDQRASTNAFITTSAIVIALVKVRLIMREFMGVRHAPRSLCHITDAIVVSMAVALVGCYAAGEAVG